MDSKRGAASDEAADSDQRPPSLLFVDPDPEIRDALESFISSKRPEVGLETVEGAGAALDCLDETAVDCVVSAHDLGETTGIDLYRSVAERAPETAFLLFTAADPTDVAQAAFDAGIDDFVQKRPEEAGFGFLLDKVGGVVGMRHEENDGCQERRPSVESVAVVLEDGEVVWTAGAVDGTEAGEAVDAALGDVVAAPERFHTRIARARSDGKRLAPLVWPRRGGGELVHWGYSLPDGDRFELYRDRTAEAEREERLQRYERLLDTASDGLYTLDVNGYYRYVNDRFVELTGYDREELLGMHASSLMGKGEFDRGQKHVQKVVADAERESEVMEMSVETKDGETIPTAIHFSPMYDEDGAYDGLVGVTRDITDQKERERELERQNERLSEFTSIVSHDLRNPLTTIEGNLQLYRETGDESRLDAIESQVQRMNTLVDELLTLAKQGHRVGDFETVDLETLVTKCWAGVSTTNLALRRPDDLGTARADRSRLAQVFENLFRNAVEHAGADVTVTVGRLEDGFYVADDGPGIDPDRRDEVLEYGVTSSDRGTGIGLAIVSDVAEAHGWDLTITESEAGGTRFEFTGLE
ncbi:PAS domain S-box protein [Halobacteriales archaeon Cl-PHB]